MDTKSNDSEISFNFSCCFYYKNLEFKCELCDDDLKWYYDVSKLSDKNLDKKYKYIGQIKLDDECDEGISILSDSPYPCILLLLIVDENTPSTVLRNSNLNNAAILTNDLYRILFKETNTSNKFDPILVIATIDGFLFNLPITLADTAENNCANLFLKTTSPIIYLDVFSIFHQTVKLFELSKEKKHKNINNCFFIVTNFGEIHVYSFLNSYNFKVQILPHKIRTCIKYKKDYLYYCSINKEIYYFNLNDLLSEKIKIKHVQNFNVESFYEENSKLYVKSSSGRSLEIIHKENERDEEDEEEETDLNVIMKNFHSISNHIVELQNDLDKVNIHLKQIQILKKIEIDQIKDSKNDEYFDVKMKLKLIDSIKYLKINITNKILVLEDNSNNKDESTFSILISIKLLSNKTDDIVWYNKVKSFHALKPSDTQKFLIDAKRIIHDNYRPIQMTIYLLYSIKNSLNNEDFEDYIKNIQDFRICIYNYKIDRSDYLLKKSRELIDDSLDCVDSVISTNLDRNFEWKQIKLENLDKTYFKDSSLVTYLMKNQTKKSEIYYDLFNNIILKVDTINENLFNLTINLNNKQNFAGLMEFKNEFIIKEVFKNPRYLETYVNHLQNNNFDLKLKESLEELEIEEAKLASVFGSSDVDEIKDDEKFEEFLKIFFKVLTIYSSIRNTRYSNINFIELENDTNNKVVDENMSF